MDSMVGGLQGDLTRLVRVPVLARKVKVVAFVKPKQNLCYHKGHLFGGSPAKGLCMAMKGT